MEKDREHCILTGKRSAIIFVSAWKNVIMACTAGKGWRCWYEKAEYPSVH